MEAKELISALGGKHRAKEAFGVALATVYLWEANGSIPAKRWSDAIRIASEAGIPGVTLESLHSAARKIAA